jgi:hypothetical protein
MNPSVPTAVTYLSSALGYLPALALALALAAMPVLAASIILTWHGVRGSDPGPAAQLLLQLTRLILRLGRRP